VSPGLNKNYLGDTQKKTNGMNAITKLSQKNIWTFSNIKNNLIGSRYGNRGRYRTESTIFTRKFSTNI